MTVTLSYTLVLALLYVAKRHRPGAEPPLFR